LLRLKRIKMVLFSGPPCIRLSLVHCACGYWHLVWWCCATC